MAVYHAQMVGPMQLPMLIGDSQVPEYSKVIKHPMDLSTIAGKARDDQYESVDAFTADLALVIDNCRKFNPPDSVYCACANKLERFIAARLPQLHARPT